MSNKKVYKLEHWDTNAEIYIEIDLDFQVTKHKVTQEEAIKEMVEFWGGWQSRLRENKGDYTTTFIKQIAKYSFIEGLENDWNEEGIVSYWSKWNEGFYPLPEIGVNITYFNCPEVDFDEISFEDVTSVGSNAT